MTSALIAITLTLVLLGGTAAVMSNAPERQAVTLSLFGLVMALLFFELQAPDVALSQLGVGAAVVPLLIMLTIRKVRGGR